MTTLYLYTDYVLAGLIDYLQEQSEHYRSGMIYMSDHGESLGELGIYLHGLSYFMAPTAQIHVPTRVYQPELDILGQCRTS